MHIISRMHVSIVSGRIPTLLGSRVDVSCGELSNVVQVGG